MSFVWSILWPALLAGSVAILVTIAIERFGGLVGGVLGTLPTTIVPAALGLWDGPPEAFTMAMAAVPAGMMVNAIFLWSWRSLPPKLPSAWPLGRRLAAMATLSLVLWAILAAGLVIAKEAAEARWSMMGTTPVLAAGATCLALTVVIGVVSTWRPRPAPKGSHGQAWWSIASRGLLAAGAIAAAIALKEVAGGVTAGMVSVFPAIFLTTMVSLWLAQGEAVPSGAVGPMMLGSTSVGAFALLSVWSFPSFGPWLGAGVAWGIAVIVTTLPAYSWLQYRTFTRP